MNKKYKIKNISMIEEELQKCIECRACVGQCRMLEAYCSSPKDIMEAVLNDKEVQGGIPYSCNLCQKCLKVCPKDIDLGRVFMEMRRELAASNRGISPMKGHSAIHVHQQLGFSRLFSLSAGRKDAKRVFLPGCSLSAYSPRLVELTYKYLCSKLEGTEIVLQCCGKPTEDLGEVEEFKKRYKLLERSIEESGAVEVITACQSCYKLISEKSPGYKVKSLWTVLDEIGVPEEAKNIGATSDLVFSIHDACPTRFNSQLQDSVRNIIKELGYKFEESEISRENTSCCGMGGMIMPVNPGLFTKISEDASTKLKNEHIITYCASCRESMARSGKKSVHILDLIFNSCFNSSSVFAPPNKIAPLNWVNRYKTKVVTARIKERK